MSDIANCEVFSRLKILSWLIKIIILGKYCDNIKIELAWLDRVAWSWGRVEQFTFTG